MEGGNRRKYEADGWGEHGRFFHRDSSIEGCSFSKYQQQEQQQQEPFLDYTLFDDLRFDVLDMRLQRCPNQIAMLGEFLNEINRGVSEFGKQSQPSSLASFALLKDYTKGRKRLNSERNDGKKLSTEEIMRIAGVKFIQSTQRAVADPMVYSPFDLSFSGLPDEEAKKVELAELLLASAEKVGSQQYEPASRLLNQCESLSSNTGNPIERVVYYFAEALRLRIDRQTGRMAHLELENELVDQAVMIPNPSIQACHEGIPFYQVPHFCGIQAIVENAAEAKRIHVIDLKIRNGLQWIVLIHALASRNEYPVELLKITAVGTTSKQHMEDTGNRLMSFAQTMNIPFSFNVVKLSDMRDLKRDLFELDVEEALAVYSEYAIKSLIVQPKQLDFLMEFIRNLNPCIMVVIEVEASHNSRVFVNRFIEALFYSSAYFDCVDACLVRNDPSRIIIESIYLGKGIRNIVACEGEERKIRNVKIDVWRKFFARFGMIETELSEASLFQVNFIIEKFACRSSCTFSIDEKSLLIGWKGTPILSLSTWKFKPKEEKIELIYYQQVLGGVS